MSHDADLYLMPATFDRPAFVAANATVIGKVTVGEDASIWFGTVIRGDSEAISVGARANVQDGCVLHADSGYPCVIGAGATLGHRAVVHGATIGEHALIGINATVLNGAKVGEYALVGAGALVPEGMEIPPRSLAVGVPAKVKRQLTDEEVAMLPLSAQHYVDAGRAFAAAGHGRPDLR